MSLFPRAILAALKTELEGATALEYVDKVDIRQYRSNMLPNFDHHCIVISPQAAMPETYPASQKWIKYPITLVLLARIHTDLYDAVMADTPGGSPPNVGILAMYEDVYIELFDNTLGGVVELYPGRVELDARTDFNLIGDESREDFIVEARMTYQPYGKRFITPESD